MVCIKVSVFVYVCVPVTVIIKGKKKKHDLESTGEAGGRDENDVDSELMHETFKNKNKILDKKFPGKQNRDLKSAVG